MDLYTKYKYIEFTPFEAFQIIRLANALRNNIPIDKHPFPFTLYNLCSLYFDKQIELIIPFLEYLLLSITEREDYVRK